MAWYAKHKATIKRYQRFARLSDADYRELLQNTVGVMSSTDGRLTNRDFDQAMAAIEAVLDYRVKEGFIPAPVGINLGHWRRRLPKAGMADTRQIHEINDWWYKLQPFLPQDKRTTDYRNAIIAKSCGCRIDHLSELKSWQTGLAIEALKDRLRWALKQQPLQGLSHVEARAADLPVPPTPTVETQYDTEDADQSNPIPLPELSEVPF